MADDVSVSFTASIEKLLSGINDATKAVNGFAEPFKGLQEDVAKIGEAIAAGFAVEKISEFVEKMAELGTQTERVSQILGISTEEVGKLNAVSLATGTSSDSMAMAMQRLALNLAKAQTGTGAAAAALQAMGLSAKELSSLPLPEVIGVLADKFSGMENGLNKTALAMALLGRGGAQLIPMLNEGREGFEELEEIAVRTGTAMDGPTAAGFHATHIALTEMGLSFQGVGITLMSAFKPAIDGVINAISDLVEWFNQSMKAGGIFSGLLDIISAAAKGLAAALLTVFTSLEVLVQGVVLGLEVLRDAVSLDLASVKKDFADFQTSVTAETEKWAKHMNELFGLATKVTVHPSASMPAPAMNMNSRDEASAAIKEIDGEIKALQAALAQKKVIWDGEVAQYKLTKDQEFGLLQSETEKEYQAELALLQREAAIGGLKASQRQEILNKISSLEDKHRTEMIKLDQQAVAAQQKTWEGYLSTISGAFNSQIIGLINRTTTWQQATVKVFDDLLMKFISMLEEMGIKQLATQLAMTTATQSGAAAQAAATQTAQVATLPARIAKFTSDITSDAAAAFAGIFANLAPLLGPAAAGPAAAGQATVLGQLANIPKYEMGTPYVPQTGLALIHQGEAIIPAGQNGAGGANVTFHVHAIDAAGVNDFLTKNIRAIAGKVSEHISKNPSLRPAY